MRAQTILFLWVGPACEPKPFCSSGLIELRGSWIVGLIERVEKAIRRDNSRLQAAPFQTVRFFDHTGLRADADNRKAYDSCEWSVNLMRLRGPFRALGCIDARLEDWSAPRRST